MPTVEHEPRRHTDAPLIWASSGWLPRDRSRLSPAELQLQCVLWRRSASGLAAFVWWAITIPLALLLGASTPVFVVVVMIGGLSAGWLTLGYLCWKYPVPWRE